MYYFDNLEMELKQRIIIHRRLTFYYLIFISNIYQIFPFFIQNEIVHYNLIKYCLISYNHLLIFQKYIYYKIFNFFKR
jgi:hypothetical protein